MKFSGLCGLAALFALSGCAAPAKVSTGPRLQIAEAFVSEGTSPSTVLVTSKVETEDCRMMAMPNGREAELSAYIANTIKLSQLSSGTPRTGAPLSISVSEFKIECGKVPAYVELRGVATRTGTAPKPIHVKETFDFALIGVEVVQNMAQAFEIAVEKFAIESVRR